jgi:hypothetical protein
MAARNCIMKAITQEGERYVDSFINRPGSVIHSITSRGEPTKKSKESPKNADGIRQSV